MVDEKGSLQGGLRFPKNLIKGVRSAWAAVRRVFVANIFENANERTLVLEAEGRVVLL